jgi:hypothetical protein
MSNVKSAGKSSAKTGDLKQVTRQLEALRVGSEGRRANRVAAPNRQDAPRTNNITERGTGGTTKVTKATPKRVEQLKGDNILTSFGSWGRDTSSRSFPTLVTKLTSPKYETKMFAKNSRLSIERRNNGEHPYNKEPEEIPVAVGLKAHSANTEMNHSLATVMTPYGPGVCITGREYMGTVVTDANTFNAGNGMLAFPLNPRALYTSRLEQFAGLYTRFIFKKFRLSYIGMPGTQNPGSIQIFGCYDPEISVGFKAGDPMVGFAENAHCADAKLWDTTSMVMTDEHMKDMLFITADEDLRWTCQGIAYLTSGGTIPVNLELAKVVLDYEVILSSDIVDIDNILPTRNFTTTLGWGAVGTLSNFTFSSSAPALAPGNYMVTFRTEPSSTLDLYMDFNSSQMGNNDERTILRKGFIGYITVTVSGTIQLLAKPDFWGSTQATQLSMVPAVATVAGTVQCNVYKYKSS